jgi:hypothetical protein
MYFPFKKCIAVASIALSIGLQAKSCSDSNGGGGPARNAAYAGDGVTQFGTASDGVSGKLKWNTTYRATAVHSTNRQNCKWSLFTINSEGVAKVVGKGDYLHAKIIVEKPNTVKVYLKSMECGLWKPKK